MLLGGVPTGTHFNLSRSKAHFAFSRVGLGSGASRAQERFRAGMPVERDPADGAARGGGAGAAAAAHGPA
jgi:hypothetical protein